jgi:VCBS repeat-containing protein
MRFDDEAKAAKGVQDAETSDTSKSMNGAGDLAVSLQGVTGAGTVRVVPGPDGVVTLPPGVDLDDIRVVGRDLVVTLPDGTQWVITDGAIVVPQLVLGDVQVPATNLAALLIGQEPQPAAGPAQSSGGNFAVPVGDIGDPFALGDLLPPTDFAFTQPVREEVIPGFPEDEDPGVIIITPDNPAGAVMATVTVNEAGLPARGNEPPGSNAAASSETAAGTIEITSGDAPFSVAINGTAITAVGQTFTSPSGTLTITSIGATAIGFSYTLTDNLLNASQDSFAITIADADGDTASGAVMINVIDDVPTARADTDTVAAGSAGTGGNVLTGADTTSGAAGADTPGADGATLNGIRAGTSGAFAVVVGAGATVAGQFGTLTIGANGTYTYAKNPGVPGGSTDVFTYQIVDGDGDLSTATLTITNADSPVTVSVPTAGPGTIVNEAGLPARGSEPPGSDSASSSESTSGTITYTAPDGPATVTVNGTAVTTVGQVIQVPGGTLTITSIAPGAIGYTYTLADNATADPASVAVPVVVTDSDGDTASATLTITIVDDVPTARNDSAAPAEDTPVVINVFANDTPGADGVNLATAVVLGAAPSRGTVIYNGDGTFTYTPTPGAEGSDSFTYTITDGDGDTSTATVTITLSADSTPTIDVVPTTPNAAGNNEVDEAGLPARGGEPAGSDEPATSETTTGTLAITTGNDTVASLIINGTDVTAGGTVTGAFGTLTITVNAGAYSYSYTLTDNSSGDATSDTFAITVTDSDGDPASGNLVIDIVDDVPTARDDSAAPAEDTAVVIDVFANDTAGADGVDLATGVALGTGPAKGTVAYNGDGTFTYTPNPGAEGADSFTYVITDGDGDSSTATVTIALAADSTPTIDVGADGKVDEAGLPSGSDAAAASETTSGTFAVTTGNDTVASLVINGTDVTAGGIVAGAFGTLTVTLNAGVYAYSYTLTTNTSGDTTADTFNVVVTDSDGDAASDTLTIDIVDDVPTARDDADSVTEDGPLTADGNVLTGSGGTDTNTTDGVADTPGADGAQVTTTGIFAGQYGTLTLNADGSYSYVLDNANTAVQGLSAGQTLTETFGYTITDGDTDTSTATLTITINGADDGVTITGLAAAGGEEVVNEDDLADGSSPDAAALTQGGTFDISTPDGLNNVTIGGTQVVAGGVFTAGLTASSTFGTVTITGFTPILGADGSVIGGTFSYSYTLTDNTLTHPAAGEDSVTDSFAVTVTDSDGSTGNASLDIIVIDDVPTASDEPGQNVNEGATVTGTLDFVQGADGATVTAINGIALVFGPDGFSQVIDIGDGAIKVKADGSYSFTADPSVSGTGSASATYTVTDGDGDTSTANLAFTIVDANVPTAGTTAASVDDDGLAGGNPASTTGDLADPNSDGDGNEATFSGTLVLNFGGDGPGAVGFAAMNGLNATLGQETVTFAWNALSGTLTATGPRGTVFTVQVTNPATGAYTVTLVDNVLHTAGGDENDAFAALTYTVTDSDGSTANGTLNITFDDDAPTVTASTTQPNLTVDETVLATNASASFASVFTPVFGADGPAAAGSVTYALGLNAGASGLTDTATGNAVVLTLEAGQIVGRAGAGGAIVFTVSVAANGTVTLDQQRAIVHANTADPNDARSPALDNLITLTATVTDGDGDTASATANIGSNLTFLDDGPSITASTTQPSLTVDETVLATNASASFAAVFTPLFGADGPAAAGSITYALGLNAGASGLTDTATGLAVALTVEAGQIVGRAGAGGAIVFTLSVAADGTVTLDQQRAIVHANTADPNDARSPALDNLITLTATATDRDGDTASATANIGSNLTFLDDGPTASPDTDSIAAGTFGPATGNVITDAAPGDTGDGDTGADTPGADGGAISRIESVNVPANVDTTADGLGNFQVAGQYGVLTINVDGSYSYTRNAGTPGGVTDTFTYTLRDGDGDTATATLAISIGDAAPVVGANATVLLDDDALPGGNPGGTGDDADGVNTSGTLSGSAGDGALTFAYQLTGAPAGFSYVSDGAGGILVKQGATTVLTITLNAATGAYAVTQNAPIVHPAGGTENNQPFTITYSVTDADGDAASGTLSINVDDDTPTLGTIQNGTANNNPASATSVGTLHFSDGADGLGPITIGANLTGITSGGKAIVTNQSGSVLTGYADVDGSGTFTAGDTAVFTLTVNPNAGTSGQYVFDLLAPLDGVTTNTPIGGSSSFGAGPTQLQVLTTTGGTQQLSIVSGWQTTGAFDLANWFNGTNQLPAGLNLAAVNGSTGGWGVDNNNFSNGEFLRFDFGEPEDDFDAGGPYSPPATTLPEVSFATFNLTSFSSGDQVRFVVHYTDGTFGNLLVTGGAFGSPVTLTAPAGKFIDWIDLYTNAGGGGGKVTLSSVGVQTTNVDVTIPFTLTLNDGDGDSVTGNFTVNVKDGNVPSTPVPPIVLDLDGDGLEFVGQAAGIGFDHNGDGVADTTAWVGADDGLLVHDGNGDGIANDGSEIIFSVDGSTDLEGLRQQYDSNGDGQLTAEDAGFASFGVWQDANGNGVTDAGEFRSLADLGIVGIDLTSDGRAYTAASGDVQVAGQATFTRADGSQGIVGDVAFATTATRQADEARMAQSANTQVLASAIAAAGVAAVAAEPVPAQPAAASPAMSADPAPATVESPVHAAPQPEVGRPDTLDVSDARSADPAPETGARATGAAPAADAHLDAANDAGPAHAPAGNTGEADAGPAAAAESGAPADIGALIEAAALPILPEGLRAAIDGTAAPADGRLATVLETALQGPVQHGPDIDALLSMLSSGSGPADSAAGAGVHFAAVEIAIPIEWQGPALHAMPDMATAAQDGVMATAHA